MMTMKWFKSCTTCEELKSLYKKLVFQYHPDRGGDAETMKQINAEYDEVFPRLKNVHRTKEGKTYEKENNETAAEFRDMIEKLMNMEGLHIEVIGCFIWISGDTKPHKEGLKELGFRWHSTKKMWYKSPEGYKRRGKGDYSMEKIRNTYGVQFESDANTKEKIA